MVRVAERWFGKTPDGESYEVRRYSETVPTRTLDGDGSMEVGGWFAVAFRGREHRANPPGYNGLPADVVEVPGLFGLRFPVTKG